MKQLSFVIVFIVIITGLFVFNKFQKTNNNASLISEKRINEVFDLSKSAKHFLIIDDFGCQSCFYESLNFINENKITDLMIITNEKHLTFIQPIADKNSYELITYPSVEYLKLLDQEGSPIVLSNENEKIGVYINNSRDKNIDMLEHIFNN